MINRSSNITDDIVASIERCHVAIVDVTGNNPNVMFELGYAIAKAKKNIIISQSADFLPFDIRNIRTIVYSNTWSGIEELKGKLQEFLREMKPRSTRRQAKSH
jgi:nucleoside 2-deoxyribosyltransferase